MTASGTPNRTRQPFVLAEAVQMLQRAPALLDAWLRHLPDAWVTAHEGGDTWSVFDIVGHLVHAERTDWLPRVRLIVESGPLRPFDSFDRTAMFVQSRGKTLGELLDTFAQARAESLRNLAALALSDADLDLQGRHPQLGIVTLRQLLATWVAHDLDHIAQVARVLAHQYSSEVGPWSAYLRVISGQPG